MARGPTLQGNIKSQNSEHVHGSHNHNLPTHQDWPHEIFTTGHENAAVVRFGGTGCTPLSARQPIDLCKCALAASHAQCASSPYDACCAGFMDDVQSMPNQQARAVKQSQCGICKAKRQATCGSRGQQIAGRTSCGRRDPTNDGRLLCRH